MTNKQPTQAATLKAIRSLGLTAGIKDGEYRVTIGPKHAAQLAELDNPGRGYNRSIYLAKAEAIAYYTTDRQDAIDTARFMAERLPFKVRS